jgi:hypothetical protein
MSWVERAEAALQGPSGAAAIERAAGASASEPDDDVEVLPGRRPSLLDAFGRRALAAPFLAALLWAAAIFRENLNHPLEPISLAFRLLALAMTVRAIVFAVVLVRRLRVILARDRYRLVLTDEGLLMRTPVADFAVAKADIVDIREPGDWQERGGARWADVFVVTRPESGRTHLALPPLFERTPGTLAERLMRWRGVVEPAHAQPERAQTELPSKLFDAAVEGRTTPGVAVIPQGRAWLQRAPFATVLLGCALLEGFLRLPAEARERVGMTAPLVISLCLVAPIAWWLLTRRSMAARKGIALLLTPAELLFRTRSGVHRVPWSHVAKLHIASRTVWTILQGSHPARSLLIERKEAEPIQYSEAFMGVPLEVVVALGDGYRKGVLP